MLALSCTLYAASSGKIAGYVTDSKTGDPIPGANIMLAGSTIGVASDIEGYYSLLNVPPGRYELKVSVIGYSQATIKDVIVEIDLTTTINVNMSVETVDMQEVIVTAERPVVKKDVSASELNVSAEKIETMPVSSVEDVISLQAGVEGGLTIRGGAARQTTFIVDGFTQNDERSHEPFTSINISTVQEIKVQTGGFNAEYGQSRSGVINVVTKSGSKTNYNGSLSFQYQPPGNKYFGPSIYSPNSYFLRPYMDEDICYVGTQNGSWDQYTQEQYRTFVGWNYISQTLMQDDNPDNDLTPEQAKRLFEYQHRRQGDVVKPDFILDASLGGPLPLIGEYLGDMRFFASHRNSEEQLIIPLSKDSYDENITNLKLTSDITPRMQLTISSRYSETSSASPYNWTTTPTGTVVRSSYSVASLASSTPDVLFVPAYYSPTKIFRNQIGAKLNHILTDRSFYEVKIQYDQNYYHTYQVSLRDTTKDYDIFPGDEAEYLVDEQPYGFWGYGVGSIGDNLRIGGWQNIGRDSSYIRTTNLKFDYVNQLNATNQFKTGIDILVNNFDIKSFAENPGMETWNREQVYDVTPYRLGLYVQDKLEFEGFIANLGLRFDYTDANTDVYTIDYYSDFYEAGEGFNIEKEAPSKKAEANWAVSPRLGISHPITENSKLYFNYGHFRTEPSSTYRFRIQRYYNGSITSIGNPSLVQEKTVSYEIGYSHNLFNTYFLNIAGYYKNITDQIGWINYKNINGSVNYSKPDNNFYEDIRGFEITLDKKVGDWVTGFINYTYMVNTSGYFGYTYYFEDPNEMRQYLLDNPSQSRPRPRPRFNANLDFHTPEKFGPNLGEFYMLGGWNLNMVASWKAGSYSTYNPNNILGVGIINNVQWKDAYYFDLRLAKAFKVKSTRFQAYLDITNVFNIKQLSSTGFDGSRDQDNYMKSLHFDWEEGSQKGDDRIGEYRDWDTEYVPMREIGSLSNISSPDSRTLYYVQDDGQYMMYVDGAWEIKSESWVEKEVLDTKAYIDMPNVRGLTFLDPRTIVFGIRFSF
ncbi:MAG: TonB-dependent receptor [Calditrichaeota bacterium]|nr:TonB-dependent receptor [Calditrichota bacterium]